MFLLHTACAEILFDNPPTDVISEENLAPAGEPETVA